MAFLGSYIYDNERHNNVPHKGNTWLCIGRVIYVSVIDKQWVDIKVESPTVRYDKRGPGSRPGVFLQKRERKNVGRKQKFYVSCLLASIIFRPNTKTVMAFFFYKQYSFYIIFHFLPLFSSFDFVFKLLNIIFIIYSTQRIAIRDGAKSLDLPMKVQE